MSDKILIYSKARQPTKTIVGHQSNIILHALLTLRDVKVIEHKDVKDIMNILYGKVVKQWMQN